ncbi:MAG: UPF0147 family protein [Candidatus Aenigmatarchaeota archaeon]|nr:UPF0147 family protein [Candidatus Aenigmarchaeota archaeon]
MATVKDAILVIDELIADTNIPKNVRLKLEEAKNELNNTKVEKEIRIGKVVAIMDEISIDINLPIYARTKIWNIVSILESIKR